ncbi:MAG: YbaK/EbsC family protein [Nitrospirota bacterium]|nr:YbaK/EbsC family protein [Nitrospirota bacterium]
MPVLKRLQTYLDSRKSPYEVVSHDAAYSARGAAEARHVPGELFAKVVIGQADQRFVMAVIPSTWRVDFKRLEEALDCRHVRLATEGEFAELFPDCEVGTMPPFGNLYNMAVYVDQLLTQDEYIFFDAGTHTGAMKLRYRDFAELVRPTLAQFHREPSTLQS